MIVQLELNFWPSSPECVQWSKDNLIAVAGGDSIAILIPRLEPGPTGNLWDRTVFKANGFTVKEVPLLEPLTFENFSISEEQSQPDVQSLAWSVPCLGKYGRCVLAVLSSNHVLSLWECVGKLDVVEDWKRVLVVNHALQKMDQRPYKYRDASRAQSELQQVSQRVRSFAWSPRFYEGRQPSDVSVPYTDNGHQFLAVSTEAGDIVILRVESPYDMLKPNMDHWELEVVQCIDCVSLTLQAEIGGPPSQVYRADGTTIVDHIAWGGINSNDHLGMRSVLAVVAEGRLFCTPIEIGKDDLDLIVEVVDKPTTRLLHDVTNITGPLAFVPETRYLVASGPDRVYCVNTASEGRTTCGWTSHHLDGRWDEVTAIAFSRAHNRTHEIHIASLLSSSAASTTALSVPFDGNQVSFTPAWQRPLKELRSAFSVKHKLHGNVIERVWGMAASPMGDLFATATVLLPSDAPVYLTAKECRTIIHITSQQAKGETMPHSAGSTRSLYPTSAILLDAAKRFCERNDGPVGTDTLLRAMSQCVRVPDEKIDWKHDSCIEQVVAPKQCARFLRLRLFLEPEIRTARLGLLADIARTRKYNSNSITKLVIQRLVDEVLRIPIGFSNAGEFSAWIYKAYNVVRHKLQSQPDTSALQSDVLENLEDCGICNSPIAFSSVKWARCTKGHQFSRCGLTFLAIQEPGISKQCSICRTPYLDESAWLARCGKDVVDVEMTDLPVEDFESHELITAETTAVGTAAVTASAGGWVDVTKKEPTVPAISLARILFAAFDRCVYCGGNF